MRAGELDRPTLFYWNLSLFLNLRDLCDDILVLIQPTDYSYRPKSRSSFPSLVRKLFSGKQKWVERKGENINLSLDLVLQLIVIYYQIGPIFEIYHDQVRSSYSGYLSTILISNLPQPSPAQTHSRGSNRDLQQHLDLGPEFFCYYGQIEGNF